MPPGAYTPLKEVAERQDISQKYLESIMSNLSKSGFVEGAQGKGGGYRLVREPGEYKVGDILRLTPKAPWPRLPVWRQMQNPAPCLHTAGPFLCGTASTM